MAVARVPAPLVPRLDIEVVSDRTKYSGDFRCCRVRREFTALQLIRYSVEQLDQILDNSG